MQLQIWLSVGATAGSSQQFTFNGYGNSGAVQLFNNVASGPDQANQFGGYGGNPVGAGNVTPNNNNEVIAGCGSNWGGTAPAVNNVGMTQTQSIAFNGGYSGNGGLGSAYEIQTTATTINVGWNTTPSYDYGNAIQTVTLFSTLSPAALSTLTTFLPEGYTSHAYSSQLQATGGVQPYTWSLTSGTLPAGLSLSAGGLISGTPTGTASATPLTFKVTDSNSTTASTSGVTLTISATPLSLSTSPSTCPTGTQYTAYAGCTVVPTGGTGTYTMSILPGISSTALPLTCTTGAYLYFLNAAGLAASPTSGLYQCTSTNVWTYQNSGTLSAPIPPGLSFNATTGVISSSNILAQGSYGTNFLLTDTGNGVATLVVNFSFAGSNVWAHTVFPSNAIFYHRMDAASTSLPVDTSIAAPISSVYSGVAIKPGFGNASYNNGPVGIPVLEVPYNQSLVAVSTYLYQSYFTTAPFPVNAPTECQANEVAANPAAGNYDPCDGHISIYLEAGGGNPASLYECWQAYYQSGSPPWICASNALWSNTGTNAIITNGTTDAAGLPLEPLLLTADDVIGSGTPTAPTGTVGHITRLTINHYVHYFVWPATSASDGVGNCSNSGGVIPTNTQLQQGGSSGVTSCVSTTGPAGEIYRLQASFTNPTCAATSPQSAIIIQGLRNYGFMIADTGSPFLIGTPDNRWVDSDLQCLRQLTFSDFEPVNVSSLIVSNNSYQASGSSGTAPSISSAGTVFSAGGIP